MTKKAFYIQLIVLLATFQMFSQSTTPVNLVKLSQITLAESPIVKQNILTISSAEGGFLVQKSIFDYQLTSGISWNRDEFNLFTADPRNSFFNDPLDSRGAGVSVGLQKTFRSSLTAALSVDYTLATDNFPINTFNQNVGAFIDNHTVSSTFSLTQPLLRGRGRSIATALEEASKLDIESADNNANFANSFELFQMSTAYWQYVSAYKSLEIFNENEARVRRVLEITEELVKADKRPAGDLAQVKADLANQERQTRVAEQILYAAKLNLGRVVGLSEETSKQLGNPLDEFPSIEASGYAKGLNETTFLQIAQSNRADIEAAKQTLEAIELQLQFTENNKRPQLDLTGFVNYGGMNMGNGIDRALAAFSRNEGRNFGYGVRLSFSFPLNNNLAKGNFIQNEIAFKDQEITTTNLQRNIDLNVSIALNNLENSVQVLEKAKEALEFNEQVFDNEQEKFKNGMTILLNLIQFQERLTFAQIEYLRAQQEFANAIVNLRFETGTLVANKNQNSSINKDLFFTIPN
ncbi:outer membrane efflux protein [Kordia sp. SMS9]|uniref:TolC family protein n=1 Tax=Kordia sp. SMS9 TaxID=2282170 RepID=UPI000E0DE7F9|nr:TolC family protein [Kordia sp. SMS9]AXG69020.1 outer membrane efflux protein [Kordia sp. SMS9]